MAARKSTAERWPQAFPIKRGDVFIAQDGPSKQWYAWLFLRPATKKDFSPTGKDSWGYGPKNTFGWYWVYVDLASGAQHVVIDNSMARWRRL